MKREKNFKFYNKNIITYNKWRKKKGERHE